MRREFTVVFFLTTFLSAAYLSGFNLWEAAAADAPIQLPPVVVRESPVAPTAKPDRLYSESEARNAVERTPGGVALVGSETIRESLGTTFKEVLDFIPGVFVQSRQGSTSEESQFSIRGSGLRNNFHIRGINILQDGFILNNADGFFRPEVLEFAATKRIEVFKGANGLRFGSNSLGGAINLVTNTGLDSRPIEFWSEGGSFGFFKNYLATGNVFGPFDLFGGFTYTHADGYRDHSEQTRQRILSNVGYQFEGGTTLRLDLGYVRNKQDLPGSLTLAEFKTDPRQAAAASVAQDERHDYHYNRAAFTVRTPLTPNQAVEWFTHYNYTDLDHPLAFAVIDNVDNNWSTEFRYIINAPLFNFGNRFITGMQYAGTRQIDYNFANNGGQRGAQNKNQINTATNVGFYFNNEFEAAPALSLIGGGRLDYSRRAVDDRFLTNGDSSDSQNYVYFTPRFGFIWKAMPAVQVFGNISRAYEPPLILELTAPGQIGGDLSKLKPQRAWQFEAGTRGDIGERFAWTFSLYDIELWDEIQNVNVQPFPGAPFTIPRFQNINRSRHWGTEVGFSALLAKGFAQPDDALRLNTAYTYSNFAFVNDPVFNNNDLPGAPAHYIQTELRYQHPLGFWFGPWIESIPISYFVNSQNTAKTPSHTIFNISAGYTYKPWNAELLFWARNLANKAYVAAVAVDDANGRYYQPGDGRAFYGGMRWKW
jgi:iron complex outermembrane receptor protein